MKGFFLFRASSFVFLCARQGVVENVGQCGVSPLGFCAVGAGGVFCWTEMPESEEKFCASFVQEKKLENGTF